MIGIALGQMGLSMETFLSLTPFEFQEVYGAFLTKQNTDREHEYLRAMRVARWQVFRTMCPPKGKQVSVMDLIELPGDKELSEMQNSPAKESTKERFNKLKEKWGDGR